MKKKRVKDNLIVDEPLEVENEELTVEEKEEEDILEATPNQRWYVINAYSGHEKRVADMIKQRIDIAQLSEYVSKIVVPTQNKIVVSDGKKKSVEERILPGYILIRMELTDDTWPLIRDTQGVIGFAGMDKKPTPLSNNEVKAIMKFMQIEQPAYQSSMAVDDAVNILEGPFKDFPGKIVEINEGKGTVKVLISIFGRETPVELDFTQVKKF